ncbi:hypothetical protein MMC13_006511 [Lambiella insularis]|nr:hypothetical protein [Lambiella insularis]
MDQARFVQLLESVLAPDTARVKAATATLRKDYYTSPQSLAALLQILTSHDSPQLRQLAATQARSLVPKHWSSVPDDHKAQIRTHILQSTLNEQTSIVRHAAARVISAIAKIDLEDGQWADLPALMQHAATSDSPQEREVSTYILFAILESMGDSFMHRFRELFALFDSTIHDPQSVEVRINTMLALSKMGMLLDADNDEESLEAFQKAIPGMVAILKQAIEAGDEDRTMQGFEVFQTLLECDPRLLSVHFRDLVQFMIQLASEKSLEKEPRSQALNFLISCIMYRKLKFQGLRVGEQLTEKALEILAESPDDSEDDDGFSLTLLVLSLLSVMASSLPPSQIIVPLLRIFKSYSMSPVTRLRQAGIGALGTCAEGAPEFLDTQLKELNPIILQLLDDPDIKVRESAVGGTKLLAEHLSETMGKEHQKYISILVKDLNRAMEDLEGADAKVNMNIVVHCCTSIDSLVDGLEADDIQQYIFGIVPHLSRLFSHPELKIKSAAIGAVGSIAECAKDGFLPYFEQTMNSLSEFVHIKESDDELDLRAMTIDAMGNMATAVGPEAFKRYVQPLMESTEEGLHLDNTRLKETVYMFWGTLAKVYGADFKPFLSGAVQALFKCLEEEDEAVDVELGAEAADLVGQEVFIAGKKIKVVDSSGPEETDSLDGLDDMDDDEDDSDWDDLAGISSIMEEQEVALEAMADLMSHTKGEYLPYLAKSIEMILPMVDNSYEAVRRAAIGTLYRAYASLWQLQDESMQKWQPGLPLRVEPSDDVMKLGAVVMKRTLDMWAEEDDRMTHVSLIPAHSDAIANAANTNLFLNLDYFSDLQVRNLEALVLTGIFSGVILEIDRSLADTLKLCGPAIVSGEKAVTKTAEILLSILKKKHACQIEDEESSEDEDVPQEYSEDDWYIIDSAMDVVTTLAAAIGERFAPLWKHLEKPILQYASSSESIQRSAAVGTIADAIRGMGQAVTPFTASILKVLLHRMSDEDPLTKSNAAFAIGLLVENSDKSSDIKRAYNHILTKLEPLLQTQESRQLDNAAGCISRMIMKHPENIPLTEVLPALVGLLPLKEDYEENTPIFSMIVKLYSAGENTIVGLTPRLLPVLAHVMASPEDQLTDETRTQLTQLVKYVHHNQPTSLQQYPFLLEVAKS